jgi:hypothetical protein
MATTTLFQIPPGSTWQANGSQGWWMASGDRDNFWGLSVRPFQANDRVRLEAGVTSVSDNNLNQTTEFVVTMTAGTGGGGLLHIMATRVSL